MSSAVFGQEGPIYSPIQGRLSQSKRSTPAAGNGAKRRRRELGAVSEPTAESATTIATTSEDHFRMLGDEWVKKETAWYAWDGEVRIGQRVSTSFGTGEIIGYREVYESCKIQLDFGGFLCCPKQSVNLGSNGTYKPIDNNGQSAVPLSHLEKAGREYEKRFAFCTEEEASYSQEYSGSPYLLVATNVKANWTAPEEVSSFRFMLTPIDDDKCALFITCMAGIEHGTIDGNISDLVAAYIKDNGLKRAVRKCHSGGGTYQPDVRIYPRHPDLAGPNPDTDPLHNRPYSRLVIEIELGNRNASGLREVGFATLDNDFSALFLGVKVWKRTLMGVFGAAAVLWEKNAVTGNMVLRSAFDFGSKQLTTASRAAWNNPQVNAMPNRLPPVSPTDWVRPVPINAGAVPLLGMPEPPADPTWVLSLPKHLLLHRIVTSPGGPYLNAAIPTLPDLSIDLRELQGDINEVLDYCNMLRKALSISFRRSRQ